MNQCISLGGFATAVDVPMFAHGFIFVVGVLDEPLLSMIISLPRHTLFCLLLARTDEQNVHQPLLLRVQMV